MFTLINITQLQNFVFTELKSKSSYCDNLLYSYKYIFSTSFYEILSFAGSIKTDMYIFENKRQSIILFFKNV